jgi:hypothetical protein
VLRNTKPFPEIAAEQLERPLTARLYGVTLGIAHVFVL